MGLLARLWPKRIAMQIIVLIGSIVLLSFAVMSVIFLLTRQGQDRNWPPHFEGQISVKVAMIDRVAAPERAALLDRLNEAAPETPLAPSKGVDVSAMEKGPPRVRMPPIIKVPPHVDYWIDRARSATNPAETIDIHFRLGDGSFYHAVFPALSLPPPGPGSVMLLSLLVTVVVLSLWAARAVTGPLSALGAAAASAVPGQERHVFDEKGPQEVRNLARALNLMQERIAALVQERTRFLVAVSHDLRTPITRLRLRAEMGIDGPQKQGIQNDLLQMERLIEGTLLYLRDGQTGEKAVRVDLSSLMQTICNNYADIGIAIDLDCPDHVSAVLRPSEMERAIANLVDNALNYAGHAGLRVTAEAAAVVIDIEDEGPGIAADQKEGLLQPFSRGDAARTASSRSGFGLGLSISRAICESHGGTLTLHDRAPQGLIARITLPQGTAAVGQP